LPETISCLLHVENTMSLFDSAIQIKFLTAGDYFGDRKIYFCNFGRVSVQNMNNTGNRSFTKREIYFWFVQKIEQMRHDTITKVRHNGRLKADSYVSPPCICKTDNKWRT